MCVVAKISAGFVETSELQKVCRFHKYAKIWPKNRLLLPLCFYGDTNYRWLLHPSGSCTVKMLALLYPVVKFVWNRLELVAGNSLCLRRRQLWKNSSSNSMKCLGKTDPTSPKGSKIGVLKKISVDPIRNYPCVKSKSLNTCRKISVFKKRKTDWEKMSPIWCEKIQPNPTKVSLHNLHKEKATLPVGTSAAWTIPSKIISVTYEPNNSLGGFLLHEELING